MKIRILLITALALSTPAPLLAQDTLAAAAPEAIVEPPPPAGLAAAETARSRRCVPVLARLDTLSTRLNPLAVRADRIRLLNDAVLREDSTAVVPFAAADSIETALRAWFAADQALAVQYAASGDSLIEGRRAEGRERIQKLLFDALTAVTEQGQAIIAGAGDLEMGARECQDVLLVRSAVVEACGSAATAVCEEARAAQPGERYRFVNAAEDLWDVESFSPWGQPTRLAPAAQGGLQGAQTTAFARRGNLMLVVSLEPMIRDRSTVPEAEQARIQAVLDSIGVTYRHPKFVIAPALAIELEVSEPLAGETHYFLHFGDLSDPAREVIWTGQATGRPIQAMVTVGKVVLDRLAAGEPVTLSAIKFTDAALKQGEAVYTLDLTQGSQVEAVSTLQSYYTGGQLGEDFAALLSPTGG